MVPVGESIGHLFQIGVLTLGVVASHLNEHNGTNVLAPLICMPPWDCMEPHQSRNEKGKARDMVASDKWITGLFSCATVS